MIIYSQCGTFVTDTSLMFLMVDEDMIIAKNPLAAAGLVFARYSSGQGAREALDKAIVKSQTNGGYIYLE